MATLNIEHRCSRYVGVGLLHKISHTVTYIYYSVKRLHEVNSLWTRQKDVDSESVIQNGLKFVFE